MKTPVFLHSLFLFMVSMLAACGSSLPSAEVAVRDIEGQPIVIQGVTVFDVETLRGLPNRDVYIKGNRITAVAVSGSLPMPENAYTIDGTGATLVPGLIDMHGHITTTTGPSWEFSLPQPEVNLAAYLYAGVTTVFDPSDASDEAFERRQQVADGTLLGPRIFTTGRIITHPDGHPRAMVRALAPWWIRWYLVPKLGSGVETVDEARKEVNLRADAGADAIKVVVDQIPLAAPSLEKEMTSAIVEQARSRGIRTVAHIGTTDDAITAAEAGVSLWVHGVYKERIPADKIQQLVDYGIPMVSTSEVFNRYARASKGPIVPNTIERDTVPDSVLQSFYPPPKDFDPGPLTSWVELMQETQTARLENVRDLHRAGMIILAGSDTQSGVFPGAGLHRELATLVAAGLTPAEAIRAATLLPARYLGKSVAPDFGMIAAGKRADLLLVEGDPSKDISALMDIREVIANGRVLDRQPVAASGE